MTDIVDLPDLPASVRENELARVMVAAANAKAARVAPCLAQDTATEDQLAEAKLTLIGAIKRWAEAGSGAVTQQTAGPFSMSTDTRQRSGFTLWPTEIADLQGICKGPTARKIHAIDTVPTASPHPYGCSVWFNAPCSCGLDPLGAVLFGADS